MSGSDDDPLLGGADDFELELGPRRRRPESSPKPSADAGGSAPAEGPDLLDLEPLQPGPEPIESLDLSLESVPPPAPVGPKSVSELSPAEQAARATTPATFDVLPPPSSELLPTVEVAAVAEYGPAPGFVGAIPYAIHVWGRRKELVSAAEDARRHRKTAEAGTLESLAVLGRAIVNKADELGGAVEALTDDLEGAKAAVVTVGHQQQEAARADVDADERRKAMSRELEVLRREIDPSKDREAKLQTQLGVRQQDLARARAQLKRAEIEQRNADHDPSRTAERAALADADRERHDKEVAVAERAVRDLEAQLVTVKQSLAEKLGRAVQLEDDLQSLGREKEQTRRAQLASESYAMQRAKQALALLARRAIAAKVAVSADAELTQKVSRADDALMRRQRRERILRAAIDSYDKPTVYQGLGILGGAALVVAVFVLFVLVRAIF